MKAAKVLALICALVFSLAGCQSTAFDGSRVGDDVQFVLEYKVLNGRQTHEMALEQGERLHVQIEHKSGRLDISVTGPDGKEIYRGNDADTGAFYLEIQQTGEYGFSVTGAKAKGSVSFVVE